MLAPWPVNWRCALAVKWLLYKLALRRTNTSSFNYYYHPHSPQLREIMAYYAQPTHTPQMQVNGGNKNAHNKPMNSNNEREWSHGLCSCCGDCGTCCVSWFLPCVVYSQNKSRLAHLERNGYPHPDGGDSCTGDCCLHACLFSLGGWSFFLQIGPRGRIRRRYRIEGGGCGDCCTAWCCTPCELTQESREIELEEQSMGKA